MSFFPSTSLISVAMTAQVLGASAGGSPWEHTGYSIHIEIYKINGSLHDILYLHLTDWFPHGHIPGDLHEKLIFSAQLDELQAFIFHISNLCLRHQDSSVQCECCDVASDFACVLLRLQCQDYMVIGFGNEPEGWEAVSGKQPPDSGRWNVAEISGAGQKQVCGTALVSCFLVAFGAGAAREEVPTLTTLAPHCWLVDQIT